MAINNYLDIEFDSSGRVTRSIQFRWGYVRERRYRLGDAISWEHWPRPDEANGEVDAYGYFTNCNNASGIEYACIKIIDDKAISYWSVSEAEYEENCDKLHFILMDVIESMSGPKYWE